MFAAVLFLDRGLGHGDGFLILLSAVVNDLHKVSLLLHVVVLLGWVKFVH